MDNHNKHERRSSQQLQWTPDAHPQHSRRISLDTAQHRFFPQPEHAKQPTAQTQHRHNNSFPEATHSQQQLQHHDMSAHAHVAQQPHARRMSGQLILPAPPQLQEAQQVAHDSAETSSAVVLQTQIKFLNEEYRRLYDYTMQLAMRVDEHARTITDMRRCRESCPHCSSHAQQAATQQRRPSQPSVLLHAQVAQSHTRGVPSHEHHASETDNQPSATATSHAQIMPLINLRRLSDTASSVATDTQSTASSPSLEPMPAVDPELEVLPMPDPVPSDMSPTDLLAASEALIARLSARERAAIEFIRLPVPIAAQVGILSHSDRQLLVQAMRHNIKYNQVQAIARSIDLPDPARGTLESIKRWIVPSRSQPTVPTSAEDQNMQTEDLRLIRILGQSVFARKRASHHLIHWLKHPKVQKWTILELLQVYSTLISRASHIRMPSETECKSEDAENSNTESSFPGNPMDFEKTPSYPVVQLSAPASEKNGDISNNMTPDRSIYTNISATSSPNTIASSPSMALTKSRSALHTFMSTGMSMQAIQLVMNNLSERVRSVIMSIAIRLPLDRSMQTLNEDDWKDLAKFLQDMPYEAMRSIAPTVGSVLPSPAHHFLEISKRCLYPNPARGNSFDRRSLTQEELQVQRQEARMILNLGPKGYATSRFMQLLPDWKADHQVMQWSLFQFIQVYCAFRWRLYLFSYDRKKWNPEIFEQCLEEDGQTARFPGGHSSRSSRSTRSMQKINSGFGSPSIRADGNQSMARSLSQGPMSRYQNADSHLRKRSRLEQEKSTAVEQAAQPSMPQMRPLHALAPEIATASNTSHTNTHITLPRPLTKQHDMTHIPTRDAQHMPTTDAKDLALPPIALSAMPGSRPSISSMLWLSESDQDDKHQDR